MGTHLKIQTKNGFGKVFLNGNDMTEGCVGIELKEEPGCLSDAARLDCLSGRRFNLLRNGMQLLDREGFCGMGVEDEDCIYSRKACRQSI